MKNAIVVGGSNGIGLSIVAALRGYDNIYVVDRQRFTPPMTRGKPLTDRRLQTRTRPDTISFRSTCSAKTTRYSIICPQ